MCIGHKNQPHIQIILLYHIQSYIELYFLHIRNTEIPRPNPEYTVLWQISGDNLRVKTLSEPSADLLIRPVSSPGYQTQQD